MPAYKVKPRKDEAVAPSSRYPTVYIACSPEIVDSLQVGEGAKVTLTGTVVGLSENKDQKEDRCELQLELRTVDAYPAAAPAEESAEKPDKDMTTGMKDGIKKGLGYTDDE